jgi:DNA-directed RNA polymerase subunit alpha
VTGITNMVIPKIEREAESRNYGKFIISPLEQGYGATIGNAMRRALLSSLGGVAITSMRIADVLHEFTDVPGVREDVVQIMLQVKKIRMKLDGVDSTRMHLEVRGEGVVTAADIIAPPEVEVVNPELYLFTVDNNKAKMDIEFSVERGRGYSPANERSGHMPIGEMPVDALFSPVKRVNWDVDYARVGQSTNYDKLMLEIWTDGSIAPEKALSMSGRVLIEHLRHIAGVSEESLMAVIEEEEEEKGVTSEVAETPIEALDLSVRVFNSLKRTGITTVGDVLDLLEKGDQAIMSIRNFGEKSLTELRQKMGEKGFLTDDDEEESEDNAE